MTQRRSAQRTAHELTDREKAWIYIQRHERVTVRDIVDDLGIHRSSAEKVLNGLKRDGYAQSAGRDSYWMVYELVDTPEDTPGYISRQVPAWRQQAWNALRVARTITAPEARRTMSDNVDIALATVSRYFRRMEKAGVVLKRGRRGKRGQPMSHIIYAIHPRHDRPTAYSTKELREMAQEGADDE